jgi:aspartate racemase
MRRAAEKLWKKKPLPLMTACTETPLAYDAAGLPQEKMVSSLASLAEATLSAIYS